MTLVTEAPSQNGTAKSSSDPKNKWVDLSITLTSFGNGILMNPMTDATLNALGGEAAAEASEKGVPFVDRAKKRIIRDDFGQIGIPASYFLGALKEAGREVKIGKKQISTASTTTLFRFLLVEGEFFVLNDCEKQDHQKTDPKEEFGWVVDKRRGVLDNKGKKVAVAIIRPKFKHWSVTINVKVNTGLVDMKTLRNLFDTAGFIGVGDFRPTCNGNFGMFTVTDWQVLS